MNKSPTLRELLRQPEILMVPGAHDAITARLAAKAGFRALYVSGSGASTALSAIPDIGLITLTEVAALTHRISQAVSLPIIIDADTGHGGTALGVMRSVRELESAGASAIQIEDQDDPKRCGHLDGKRLVPVEEMVGKIKAAIAARKSPDFLVIGRTDARTVGGLSQAIERARLWRAAGADIIFPEALQNAEEFRTVARAIDAPLMANMTEFGKTPYYTAQEFQDWGYRIVLYPVSALRIANRAMLDFFTELRQTGTQRDSVPKMLTRKELYEIIEYARYEDEEHQFSPNPTQRVTSE